MDHLNRKYDANLDPDGFYRDLNNYTIETYGNIYMGRREETRDSSIRASWMITALSSPSLTRSTAITAVIAVAEKAQQKAIWSKLSFRANI